MSTVSDLAMNLTTPQLISLCNSICSKDEDFLTHKIELSHVPDGRHLDSDLLLHAIINVIVIDADSHVLDLRADDVNITNTPAVGSEETLGNTLYKISRELRLKCLEDGEIHTKTMLLLDKLGGYTWDAKVVLILAAFATNYAEFRLIIELNANNSKAESLAVLKKLPSDLTMLGPLFKALSLLIDAIIEVTKCIIKFERLPFQQVLLDYKQISATKSQICKATYWIFRSLLACCSIFTNMPKTISKESHLSAMAVWELSSLVLRLNSLCGDLRRDVNICHQQIETRLYMKLLNLFEETYEDNQEVLHTLFCSKDNLPLKNCPSQANVDISELKDKVIIVLVSKIEVFAIEALLFLVEQTYDHLYHKKAGNYEILWVPIPASDTWTLDERRSFIFLSNSLPWFSIRQPWLLSSSTVKFIKQEWKFKEDPLMVVIDLQGQVINSNAIDMVFIWGARAFPFSTLREKDLWEDNTRIIQLIIDGIDPLLMHRIEEGKDICMYGSDDIDWIREFSSRTKEIKRRGLQVEVIYAGTRNASREVQKKIISMIEEENLSVSLSVTKIDLLWIRWKSMMKSIVRIRQTVENDSSLTQVLGLLDIDENSKGWVLIGDGSSNETVKLQGDEKVFDNFPLGLVRSWYDKIGNRSQGDHTITSTSTTKVMAYDGVLVCDVCKRPMKKYVRCL